MGKDIGKVLKAGTAFKGALKEAKNGRGSSKAIDLEVPLNTEFCGTTLKKLMKDEGITRQEATAVFMAWKESCDEQGLPSGPALKQKPSKVLKGRKAEDEKPPTRIRGKAAPPNKRPAPETESGKSSKKAKASTDDESRVFAPANAQEVADFFGIEKEKLLKKNKKKQPESSEVVEDLDGESWDEAEGCGEEREEEERGEQIGMSRAIGGTVQQRSSIGRLRTLAFGTTTGSTSTVRTQQQNPPSQRRGPRKEPQTLQQNPPSQRRGPRKEPQTQQQNPPSQRRGPWKEPQTQQQNPPSQRRGPRKHRQCRACPMIQAKTTPNPMTTNRSCHLSVLAHV